MNSNKRISRIAGFNYLLVVVFGMFALMVVRPNLVVPGDAAATASNILASESLFRLGVVSELIMYVCFLLLPLPLYALFKPVNRNLALLMVLFVIVAVPMGMLNTLNDLAALSVISGADYLTGFTAADLQARMMFFLNLHETGYLIAQIFFGAWLLPFGYLIYKSGYFPRVLGLLIILGGLAQMAHTFTALIFPGYDGVFITIFGALGFSELLICLWLLIVGARERPQEARALEPARV